MSAVKEAAQIALTRCLAVESGDYVLIVTDEVCRDVGRSFRDVAEALDAETLYLEYRSRDHHGEEPPIGVGEIMREMDVVVAATAMSISHTDARRRACKAGARIATMPGVTASVLEHCLNVDVDALAQRVREVAKSMHGRSEVHITSELGTDLRFSLEGSRAFQDTGMIRQPGDFGNLPAGKVSIAPVEGSARGDIVVDGSLLGHLLGDGPVKIRVEAGRAASIEGGKAATELKKLFDAHGDAARNLAAFGLGVHEGARLTGNALEDEKVRGAIHLAFGDNRSLGGSVAVPVHEVCVLRAPKVTLDGRTLVEGGEINL
jgi:leucyl aminopeptidase (aminopeptidase T)